MVFYTVCVVWVVGIAAWGVGLRRNVYMVCFFNLLFNSPLAAMHLETD